MLCIGMWFYNVHTTEKCNLFLLKKGSNNGWQRLTKLESLCKVNNICHKYKVYLVHINKYMLSIYFIVGASFWLTKYWAKCITSIFFFFTNFEACSCFALFVGNALCPPPPFFMFQQLPFNTLPRSLFLRESIFICRSLCCGCYLTMPALTTPQIKVHSDRNINTSHRVPPWFQRELFCQQDPQE